MPMVAAARWIPGFAGMMIWAAAMGGVGGYQGGGRMTTVAAGGLIPAFAGMTNLWGVGMTNWDDD